MNALNFKNKIFVLFFRYITWIDRDPETIARQEALKKRDKMSKDDEERMAEFIRSQVNHPISCYFKFIVLLFTGLWYCLFVLDTQTIIHFWAELFL